MEMKYSEAKTIIEFARHFLCSRCYPYIEYGVSKECDSCRERKAYDLAIEALEKQIPPPKPPYRITRCLICGRIHISASEDDRDKYCKRCGCLLEW